MFSVEEQLPQEKVWVLGWPVATWHIDEDGEDVRELIVGVVVMRRGLLSGFPRWYTPDGREIGRELDDEEITHWAPIPIEPPEVAGLVEAEGE